METDIFDEYAKLALASGLISEAKEEKNQNNQNNQYRNKEKSQSQIEKKKSIEESTKLLYGVKPEKISIPTDESFWEAAHPETAVGARSYDAMNGVWENLFERQDVMAHIATKTPTGQLFGTRYVSIPEQKAEAAKLANKALMDSLVSTAMLLDSNDETQLMTLADSCIERFSDKMTKQGTPALLLPLGIGAAALALAGGAYWFLYGDATATNVIHNSELVLEALKPLSSEPYADTISTEVQSLIDSAKEAYEEKDQIVKLISPQDATTFAARKQEAGSIAEKLKNYTTKLDTVSKEIPKWVAAITITHTNTESEKESDWYAKLEQIGKYVWWKPWQTLVNRLYGSEGLLSAEHTSGLYGAIKKDKESMAMAEKYAEGIQPEVQQHVDAHTISINKTNPAPVPTEQPKQ